MKKHILSVEIANLVKDEHHIYSLDLTGYYQTKNLITVLEAVHNLQKQRLEDFQAHVEKALQHVKKYTGLQGRWEVIHQHPTIVLDVGHNTDGYKQIVAQIEFTDYNDLHIIIGMVKDKDVENILATASQRSAPIILQGQIFQEQFRKTNYLKEERQKAWNGNHYRRC